VPPGPAVNISTRANVGTGDEAMIGGFIIQGGGSKKVIIRAMGPSLASAGVSNALSDPALQLFDGGGNVVAQNDDWVESADKQAIIDCTIPPTDNRESAIVATLAAGNYTAVVRGAGETSGTALVEIYDLDNSTGRIANISTRGIVQNDDDAMIGGFILGGDAPGRVLVRAIGPSLDHGSTPVPGALSDPKLELRDSEGNLMASNDNWQDGVQRASIEATGIAPLEAAESAIIATLDPGNYTALVRGASGTTGIGLVEVYKLD
jgi:hypothetical protein